MKPKIIWSGGPREFDGMRGKLLIAKITKESDGYWLYDQRDTAVGLGTIYSGPYTVEELQRRAEAEL